MDRKRYIGVDESNLGRFPEIYVAVLSLNELDIKEGPHLPKRRRAVALHDVIAKRDFRYILIPKEFKREFGSEGIQAIVLAEFIKNFGDLNGVYVDGCVNNQIIKKVKKIVYPKITPKIKGIVKGDEKIPLVHMADYIAHQLFRYYTERNKGAKTNGRRGYIYHLLTPRLEEYAHLLGGRR